MLSCGKEQSGVPGVQDGLTRNAKDRENTKTEIFTQLVRGGSIAICRERPNIPFLREMKKHARLLLST